MEYAVDLKYLEIIEERRLMMLPFCLFGDDEKNLDDDVVPIFKVCYLFEHIIYDITMTYYFFLNL